MDFLLKFIISSIDTSLYIIFAYSIFDKSVYISMKKVYVYLLVFLLLSLIDYTVKINISIYVPLIVLFFIIKGKLLTKIFKTIAVFLIIMIIQQIVILFFNPSIIDNINYDEINHYNLYNTILILVLSGIVKLIKSRINHDEIIDNTPTYFYPIVAMVVMSLIFPLTIFYYFSKQLNWHLKLFMTLTAYLSIVFLLIAIYLFIKNNKQKEIYYNENIIKDQLLATQRDYYDSTVKNYEYINSFKHDIQAHIRILKSLEEENNYEELHNYLDSLQYEYQKGKVYKCSNVYISALVNSFIMEGKNNNIELMVDYSINGMITMNNIHLCSLLHNLLSNAIEAETMYPNDNKNIKLNIYSLENDLQIDISNHLEDESKIDNINKNITTKDNKRDHGIGLINIQKVINDYNGLYKTYYVGDILTISILLQDVVKL